MNSTTAFTAQQLRNAEKLTHYKYSQDEDKQYEEISEEIEEYFQHQVYVDVRKSPFCFTDEDIENFEDEEEYAGYELAKDGRYPDENIFLTFKSAELNQLYLDSEPYPFTVLSNDFFDVFSDSNTKLKIFSKTCLTGMTYDTIKYTFYGTDYYRLNMNCSGYELHEHMFIEDLLSYEDIKTRHTVPMIAKTIDDYTETIKNYDINSTYDILAYMQ